MPTSPPPAERPQPPPPSTLAWQPLFFKVLVLGSLLAALLWLLVRLRTVAAPILVGFFIAYTLHPLVLWLRRWRVPPVLALTVPVLAVLVLLGFFVIGVLPTMGEQLIRASQEAPGRLYNWLLRLDPWCLEHIGRRASEFVSYQDLSAAVQAFAKDLFGQPQSLLGVVLTSARDLLVAVGRLLLVLVVAFFLLEDHQRILDQLLHLVPRHREAEVRRLGGRIAAVMHGFIRGQLLLLGLAMLTFTAGMGLLQVPFWLVMGPTAAVVYLVPYVGVLSGTIATLLLTALGGGDTMQLLGVLFLFGAFYSLDLVLITPKLIGNRVGLPPLAVLLGIIAFGELFGVIGVLIAVPLLACGRILLVEALDRYRRSQAYLGTTATDTQAVMPSPSPPSLDPAPPPESAPREAP